MSNIAMQLVLTSTTSVTVGNRVLFNTTLYSSGNITYNSSTGIITFLENGRYIIDWWLAVQTSNSTNGLAFSLTSSQGDNIISNSPIKTTQVYGMGIIDVLSAPVTLSLVNVSTFPVNFSTFVPVV